MHFTFGKRASLRRKLLGLGLVLFSPWLLTGRTSAADEPPPAIEQAHAVPAQPDPAALAHFEAKIRPLLVTHCYKCHSAAAGKAEGGLLVDTRDDLRTGGDRGPAVVPGDPAASWLLTALDHSDPDLKMPPKKDRVSAAVLADVRTWIAAGAADPRDKAAGTAPRPPVDLVAGRQFWSFRKPVTTAPPATANQTWGKGELDAFILAKLEAAKLSPSPDAEPATLLRRLHFDLVGLPPSPAARDLFLQQVAATGIDAALATEVDRLLASPQFGERWGRHWLDVARFAESSGKEANMTFPYAWRYRDYVFDAVQQDLPYDRFLQEQIAGDLLPAATDAERARLLIATGFLAIGPKNLDEATMEQFAADLIDEQIDTITRATMASSVACARCHDHKFDPFSMTDYYALAGIFKSSKMYFGTYVTPSNRIGGDPLPLPRGANLPILHPSVKPTQISVWNKELAALRKRNEEGMAAILKASLAGEDTEKVYSLTEALGNFWKTGGLEGQLEKYDPQGQALPLAMGVLDASQIVAAPLLASGEIAKPGKEIPRGFPQVIALPNQPELPASHSGRLELARWLTHPAHPLTARVQVNRIWKHLFGTGLVRTVDNFGFSGERPSHPELLDQLTVRFITQGWSTKSLIRELVLSRTYRQSSTFDPAAFQVDPENRLVWRIPKRRLEAEAIRDAMLAASGELDLKRPLGSLVGREIGDRPVSLLGLDARLPADLDGCVQRSVYLPVLRDRLPDVLDLFDFAETSLVTGERETTNVPVQALYLMNSPFVQARASGLARRIQQQAKSEPERIQLAYLYCFGRQADPTELKLAERYLRQAIAHGEQGTEREARAWSTYCQALFCAAEFRNLD